MSKLQGGPDIGGIRYGPIEAAYDQAGAWLHVVLREGGRRSIGGVCAFLSIERPRVMRLAFGAFELGELKAGAIEEVPPAAWLGSLGGKFGQAHEDRRRQIQGTKPRSASR
jgi:23S rRNA pseudouridine2605 synthase